MSLSRIKKISEISNCCEEDIVLKVPLKFRRGVHRKNERKSIESAVENIKKIARLIEKDDWSEQTVLDFGCGVKFTQAIVQYGIDIHRYVGMDVSKGMIRYLTRKTNHSNLVFYHVPFHNDKYNQKGKQLTRDSVLPGEIQRYDIMILQSVFTHFNPSDIFSLLSVLKRYSWNKTTLFFTCIINNEMEQDFMDMVPGRPMQQAHYKEAFIRKILDDTGWNTVSFSMPSNQMRHQFVCRPVF